MAALFEERYPNIAAWVQDGWIEIGHDSNSGSFIRVLDEGGLVWESDKPLYNSELFGHGLSEGQAEGWHAIKGANAC